MIRFRAKDDAHFDRRHKETKKKFFSALHGRIQSRVYAQGAAYALMYRAASMPKSRRLCAQPPMYGGHLRPEPPMFAAA
jgi:hypothetical protein